MDKVIPLHRSFDGSDLTPDEISNRARELGWAGLRIDADEYQATGKLMVYRMSRKEAYGE